MEKSLPENASNTGPTVSKPASKIPKPTSPSSKDPKSLSSPEPTNQSVARGSESASPGAPTKLQELAEDLQGCSWDQLQERFTEAMDERSEFESALQKETAELLEVFIIWSQTTGFHDEDRAYKRFSFPTVDKYYECSSSIDWVKRFKTRMDYVKNCETNLEDKKQHYTSVVKAFESALAMLRDD